MRTQIKKKEISKLTLMKKTILVKGREKKEEKKIIVIKKQAYKSIAYSDKNKNAKYAPEYSVLNPETNSDSDSLKSKGARWVSAKIQTNQTGKIRK